MNNFRVGYPQKYWHILTRIPFGKNGTLKEFMQFDLSLDGVEQIVSCWRANTPFLIGEATINRNNVRSIKIVHTDESRAECAKNSQSSSFNPENEVFQKGTDYAQELLFTPAESSGATTAAFAGDLALLIELCCRIRHAAKVLVHRRKDKPPYTICDEYDVQDLLQAILRAYFKHSVQENPLPKNAGLSSRADLSVEELGAIIEIKYARRHTDQERFVREFAQDQQSYTQWQHLKHFVYVVYRSDNLKDPEALLKLAGQRNINEHQFEVHIVLA